MSSPRHAGVFAIEPIDWVSASDRDVAAYHRLDGAIERAAGMPEALVAPYPLFETYLRVGRPLIERRSWVIRDGEELAAVGRCAWEDVTANRDHVALECAVRPDRQGEGLERALLGVMVEAACDDFSARILDLEERLDDALLAPWQALGFEVKLRTPRNVLWTRDLNRDLLGEWVARAQERASDYELVRFDGPCPDDLLAEYLELRQVMNTAPLEELDWDDEAYSAEQLRSLEAWDVRRRATPWVLIARHVPSGELAGFTVLIETDLWPETAWQGDTGVLPAHRERGLGRWLKAVNALRLLDEWPAVETVTTWNAGSNKPMLGINYAMGYAALEWWGELQAEAKSVRDLLAAT